MAGNASHKKAYYHAKCGPGTAFAEKMSEWKRVFRQTEQGRAISRSSNRKRKEVIKTTLPRDEANLVRMIYQHCPAGFEVDHLVPLSKGGAHHPDNLQYLPHRVNWQKQDSTDPEWQAFAVSWQSVLKKALQRPSREGVGASVPKRTALVCTGEMKIWSDLHGNMQQPEGAVEV